MIKRILQYPRLIGFLFPLAPRIRENSSPFLAALLVGVALLTGSPFTQKTHAQTGGNGRWEITAGYIDYYSGVYSQNGSSTTTGGLTSSYPEGCWYTGTQPSGGFTLAGWAIIQFTWQPTNGDSSTDKPPTHLTVFARKNITSTITVNVQGGGTFNISDQDALGSDQIVDKLNNIGQSGTYNLDSQGGQWGKADLSVTNGVAKISLPFVILLSVQRIGAIQNYSNIQISVNPRIDCCLAKDMESRIGNLPHSGCKGNGAGDPSFTRWLPLSFSPQVSSQPLRMASGALPGPWGDMNCAYSIRLWTDPNADWGDEPLWFLPEPGSDGTYNSPNTSVMMPLGRYYEIASPPNPPQWQDVLPESTWLQAPSWVISMYPGIMPAIPPNPAPYNPPSGPNPNPSMPRNWTYSIIDADGGRVIFNQNLIPLNGTHSTLIPYSGSFQLTNAGPPGSLGEKGIYTYTFGPVNPNSGVAPLLSIADDKGNVQTLNWTTGGMTVTDSSSGRYIEFTTGSNGYFSTALEPGTAQIPGTQTNLSWDAGGHMTQVQVTAQGSNTPVVTDAFTYGDAQDPDSLTQAVHGSTVSSYAYQYDQGVKDLFGNLIARIRSEMDGSPNDFSSSDDGGAVAGTTSYGYGYEMGYDSWGLGSRTDTITDPRGNATSIVYGYSNDSTDNTLPDPFTDTAITSVNIIAPSYQGAAAGSNSSVIDFTPDMDNPSQITCVNPFGQSWLMTCDANGNVTSEKDPLGNLWQYAYAGIFLNTATDPTGLTWTLNWNGSLLNSVQDPSGQTRETLQYNGFGQPTSLTVPAAVSCTGADRTVSLAYDATTGDLTSLSSPTGDELSVDSYDGLGDPLGATTYPDTGNPGTSQTPLRETLTWDPAQELTQSVQPNGVQTANTWLDHLVTETQTFAPVASGGNLLSQMIFNYDSRGRLYKATDLEGVAAQYRYDRSDNLTQVWDGDGNVTKVACGANDEPLQVTWPGGQFATLQYDLGGRVISSTDERGDVIPFQYDNANRLTAMGDVQISYDAAGRPLVVSSTGNSETMQYDPVLKRLTSVTTVIGNYSYTVSYAYTGDGHVASMTSPVGVTTYGYDADGRLVSMRNPFGETTTWAYDHSGRMTSQSVVTSAGATIASAYSYGASGQPGDASAAPFYLNGVTETVNGAPFESYALTHSYLDQVTGQSETGPSTGTDAYQYDPRGRLSSESENLQVNGQPETNSASFSFDLANNPEAGTGGWSYNNNNQVTTAPAVAGLAGGTGLAYDASGNLTSLNGETLSWDAWGELSGVTGTPSGNVTYAYDAFGRRMSKTVGSSTTYYLYDGDALIAEIDASTDQVTKAYTWGADGLVSDHEGTQSRFYLFDALGNTRSLLDPNGNLLASAA